MHIYVDYCILQRCYIYILYCLEIFINCYFSYYFMPHQNVFYQTMILDIEKPLVLQLFLGRNSNLRITRIFTDLSIDK